MDSFPPGKLAFPLIPYQALMLFPKNPILQKFTLELGSDIDIPASRVSETGRLGVGLTIPSLDLLGSLLSVFFVLTLADGFLTTDFITLIVVFTGTGTSVTSCVGGLASLFVCLNSESRQCFSYM